MYTPSPYLIFGPDRTQTIELLTLAMGQARSARQAALGLLDAYGSLSALAQTEPAEWVDLRLPGLGPKRAQRLHAALHLGRRSIQEPRARRDRILDTKDAFQSLAPGLQGLPVEELHALYLNRQHHVLAHRTISRGTESYTIVSPNAVFRPALVLKANAIILAHNHPSGDPQPSEQDLSITRSLQAAAKHLGLSLLDHLIIAGEHYTSLAERGELRSWAQAPGFIR